MTYKIRLSLLLLLFLSSCTYSVYTTKIHTPIDRVPLKISYKSSFDVLPEGEQQASIGDELFRISRYEIGREEYVTVPSPLPSSFPINATWRGTYLYSDGTNNNLVVYTTPQFYNSQIGVILDAKEQLATTKPLVQLGGIKEGRRWKVKDSGNFFASSIKLIERWGIRYGGRSSSSYIFELFNKNDANVVEILQSIKISEQDFLDGFTVRGVFIKGLEKDNLGIIKYKVQDKLLK
ncbi:MAG: hypothetical protein WC855_13400 [Thermodesulfovibrionales bacterium]